MYPIGCEAHINYPPKGFIVISKLLKAKAKEL
jgi:hypothetical protein